MYKVSKRTISSWIKSLCDAGYISCEFHADSINPKIKIRCLRVEKIFYYPHEEFLHNYRSKLLTPLVESIKENNIENNIIFLSKILNDEISQQNKEETNQEKEVEIK